MKKKVIGCLVSVFVVLNLLSGCGENKKEEEVKVTYDGYVSLTEGFTNVKVTDENSAIDAIESVKDIVGIKDADKELKISNVEKVEEKSFYRAQQYYEGIPVYGKSIVVVADKEGTALLLDANSKEVDEKIKTKSNIKKEEVKKAIEKYVVEEMDYTKDSEITIVDAETELVLFETEDSEMKIAYDMYVKIFDKTSGIQHYEFLVDARKGKILKTYSMDYQETVIAHGKDNRDQKRVFNVEKEASSKYVMKDIERNIQVFDVENNVFDYIVHYTDEPAVDYVEYKTDVSDSVKEVVNTKNQWKDEKAVTVMANLTDTYDFYDKILKRKGTNGEENTIKGFFNDSMPSAGSTNAYCWSVADYWQKEIALSFGTDNTLSLDTIAHEYTHGVERSISCMEYEKESGAIMEAYSDIFGELAEDYANDGIMNGNCDWVHNQGSGYQRSLIKPSDNGKPETYKGKNWHSTEDSDDWGGVHTNHTVISRTAYLMSSDIDTTNLAKLWYQSLQIMPSNATFEQCAEKVVRIAKMMNQEGKLTSQQVNCVVQAFVEVGIAVSADSTTTVSNGSTVCVLGVFGEAYDNYHLAIYRLGDGSIRNPSVEGELIVEVDVTDSKGYVFDLEEGYYMVTASDNAENGSAKEYSTKMKVIDLDARAGRFNRKSMSGSSKQTVYIQTNYCGNVAENIKDFTIPKDKIMTIGEIDVIEPEIITKKNQIGASYTFNWTSSNEDVATVSATGESGIVRARAKGETTITSSIDVGGRTITKSLNLRVASEGRDTVLVLDISGSMSGRPLDEMKQAAINFCNDLLADEFNNRVGIVFYEESVETVPLTNDLNYLISYIESVYCGDMTNMEAGVAAAKEMLDSQGADDSIKNIVVMADGLPNEGAVSGSDVMVNTYYETMYANAVIDTAREAMKYYNVYSLGLYHKLDGDERSFATELMQNLTNMPDGYHEVEEAENLQFAFGDISDTISDGSKIIINVACPVDVEVTYNGEVLSSVASNYNEETSFGRLQLLGENQDIKVVTLDPGVNYDVSLTGTDDGEMNYSVNYLNEDEEVIDYRDFPSIPITATTTITSNTDNSVKKMDLNVDEDSDGEIDVVWSATECGTAEITYDNTPEPVEEEPEQSKGMEPWQIALLVFAIFAVCGSVLFVTVILTRNASREGADQDEIPIRKSKENEKKTEDKEEYARGISILSGSMSGMQVPLEDGEILYVGKDPKRANIVFTNDYKMVSRLHCVVTYSSKYGKYFVTDCSSNGTFYQNKRRLEKGVRVSVNEGTVLLLANEQAKIQLM